MRTRVLKLQSVERLPESFDVAKRVGGAPARERARASEHPRFDAGLAANCRDVQESWVGEGGGLGGRRGRRDERGGGEEERNGRPSMCTCTNASFH